MDKFFANLHRVLLVGLIVAIVVAAILHRDQFGTHNFWAFVFRWIHVWFGVLWIGLLYYFNFVQVPSMPKIPDEHKPAISKVIAPAALFYFRWAAAGTVLFGLITAEMNGYLVDALTFNSVTGAQTIGLGMWLALIMAFNVWVFIWPNQKKVLGLVEASADDKKKAGRVALIFSRTNTLLSIPMLYCMVGFQNVG